MNLHVIPWPEGHANTWVYDGPDHVATLWDFGEGYIEVFVCEGKPRCYEFIGLAKNQDEAVGKIAAYFVWKRITK